MTTQQLVDDLEKNRLAAQQLFNIASPGTFDVPTIVEQAIAEQRPAPGTVTGGENPTVALGGAFHGATVPLPNVTVGQTTSAKDSAPVPGAPKPVIPAPQVDLPETGSFYDMLLRNDAYRLANQETMERNEKANRARTRIAAITDALASLGNLVGTTQGAFSQPQTYQVPFVHEDAEKARAEARNTANMLLRNDQSLRLAERREDMANRGLDRQLVVQQAIADRQAAKSQADLELERERQKGKMELEGKRQEGRIDLKKMDLEYKGNKDQMLADLRARGINISAGRLAEMVRHNHAIEAIRENGGGSGNVGAYTTYVEYDEYGRVVKRWRVPGNGGSDSSSNGDNAPWASGNNDNAPWAQ